MVISLMVRHFRDSKIKNMQILCRSKRYPVKFENRAAYKPNRDLKNVANRTRYTNGSGFLDAIGKSRSLIGINCNHRYGFVRNKIYEAADDWPTTLYDMSLNYDDSDDYEEVNPNGFE